MTDGGKTWVTLATNDSYALGAVVLAYSLKRVNTRAKLVVMVTPGISAPMSGVLNDTFNEVVEVNVLDSEDVANLALLTRPELGITFTKLHCWRLTQYEKCVFLDADTLVLQNCDELFDRDEFSAAPDSGWPDCFNSGVFVFTPSLETYSKLLQFALEKGSFDGGDQGLLNLYFSDWSTRDISKHLPFIYNMVATATYSYLPAYRVFGQNVKIAHFIGPNKPWILFFDSSTGQVRPEPGQEHLQDLLQAWWDIFRAEVHPKLSPEMGDCATEVEQVRSTYAQILTAPTHEPCDTFVDSFSSHSGPSFDSQLLGVAIQRYPPINVQMQQQQSQHNQDHSAETHPRTDHDTPPHQHVPPQDQHYPSPNSNNYIPPPPPQSPKNWGGNQGFFASSDNSYQDQNPSEVHNEPPQYSFEEQNKTFAQDNTDSQIKSSPSQNTQPQYPPLHVLPMESGFPWETPHPFSINSKGLAGAYAKMTLHGSKSWEQLQYEDSMRKSAWEQGHIDYLGRDSFNNIMARIQASMAEAVIGQRQRAKSPSPAKKPTSKQRTPEKSPPPITEPAQQAPPSKVGPTQVFESAQAASAPVPESTQATPATFPESVQAVPVPVPKLVQAAPAQVSELVQAAPAPEPAKQTRVPEAVQTSDPPAKAPVLEEVSKVEQADATASAPAATLRTPVAQPAPSAPSANVTRIPPQKSAEELEDEKLAAERQALEKKLTEQKIIAEQKLQEEKQRVAATASVPRGATAATTGAALAAAPAPGPKQTAPQPQAPPRGKPKDGS